MDERQKESNYNVLASPYISDQELSLKIQRNVVFAENYLKKIEDFFEHEVERQIAYREMGAIVYSSIEGILKAIVIEIDKRCENRKCSKEECPYRNKKAVKVIHKIHTIDALLFLFDIRLFWLPPLEIDELRRLNYMRNFVHISKNIKDIIEEERFNSDYVEKMLKYYNKMREQLDVSGYYFDKDNLCIGEIDEFAFEDTKKSNLRDRQFYYESKLDSCLKNLIRRKAISDEEIGALRMLGVNEELALDKTSEYVANWLVEYSHHCYDENKYNEDVNSVFAEMSKYINEEYMNKVRNSYNEIKEQNGEYTIMKFLRCKVCGKIVALVNDCSSCPTKCCGEAMEEIPVNTQDGAHEKHVPVYEVVDNIVNVKVGEVDHPMLEAHYIQWIALQTNLGNQRKVLQPGQEPKAQFALLPGEQVVAVYEYCNLHGLYKA